MTSFFKFKFEASYSGIPGKFHQCRPR